MLNDAPPRPEDHATPPCPHFGKCGGCQLQHLTYAAQLQHKAVELAGSLAAAGLSLPELQLHGSPPLAYRNRIRLTLAVIEGQLRAGYIRAMNQGGELFLPITQCPIAAPILWRAAEASLSLVNRERTPWLVNSDYRLDQLELFTNAEESALQLTLYLRSQPKTASAKLDAAFVALCDKLRAHVPELTGAGIALLPPASSERSRRAEIPRRGPTWHSPGVTYRVADTDYWVSRGAFFQVNRFLLPELLQLVTANRAGPLAWDLYAGAGLFSKALARSFAQVTAVEIAESSFTSLNSTKLSNLQAVQSTALDFLTSAVLQRERPSLVVLDPPRTGAGPEICALLARIAAPALIYVSCSPQTLPADLKHLTASGYTVAELHLLDLFPQTTHIETAAILSR
jgi:23S rRNA (uracil1939-C5)-methyltransferase